MSELREQLKRARGAYLAVQYPGNLAVDVLWGGEALQPAELAAQTPPPVPRWRILVGSAVGLTGVAAVILMFLSLQRPPREAYRVRPRQRDSVQAVLRLPPRPQTPGNVRFAPSGAAVIRVSSVGAVHALPAKPAVIARKRQ